MLRSPPPERISLTGADCFLWAFDAEVRRFGSAGHLSQLVLRLGPGLSVESLQAALDKIVEHNPILRSPIARRRWVGAPEFRLDRASACEPPRLRVHEGGSRTPEVPRLFFDRLNGRLDSARGQLLTIDVVRYASGESDVALTWIHLLFDGAGSEAFVELLEACAVGTGVPQAPISQAAPVADSLRGLGAQALAWRGHQRTLGDAPPASLSGPLRREPQNLEYELWTLEREQTARAVERAHATAGFLTPMLFYLAAAIRAHHAVFAARRALPPSYVVPLPVNLRPKGAPPAVFQTRVSMLWFQVFPDAVGDFEGLVDVLKRQRRELIRSGSVEGGIAAMEFARYAPRRLYARLARRDFRGELCSFFFAYTDAFLPDTPSFMGAPILNGFHAPSVPVSPGSGSIMSLRDGRLNAAHVRQVGVLARDEVELFRAQLLADLLGEA